MWETLPVHTPSTPANWRANTAAWTVVAHAKWVANVLDNDFTRFLSEVRAVDTGIKTSLSCRDSRSKHMWMVKLAMTEPQTQILNEWQVNFPDVETSKIQSMIEDLNAMVSEAEYRKLKTLLVIFIPQLFPTIFEHSRAIQLGLSYAEIWPWVDQFRECWDQEKVRAIIRTDITEIDRGILREIIARMELFYHYTWVLSSDQSQQLLPSIDENSEYMKAIFQAISDLCFQVRWSKGIPQWALAW